MPSVLAVEVAAIQALSNAALAERLAEVCEDGLDDLVQVAVLREALRRLLLQL